MTDEQRLALNRAAELSRTVNSLGWGIAMKLAEDAVSDASERVMTCEDDALIVGLQKKAQAAREFLADWKRRIEAMKNVAITPTESFIEVSMQ
jgi:hypothetical protein